MNDINKSIKDLIENYSWIISLTSMVMSLLIAKSLKKYELEKKSYLTNIERTVDLSLKALTKSNELQYERNIYAIDELWKAMIKLKNFTQTLNFYFDILLPNEYNKFLQKIDINQSNISEDELFNEIEEIVTHIRPYLPPEIWIKFSIYRNFIGRNIFLFNKGIKNSNIIPWYEDKHLLEMYYSLMGEYKLKDYKTLGSFSSIINIVEEIILLEMRNFISGNNLSKEIMEKSIDITKKTSELRKQ